MVSPTSTMYAPYSSFRLLFLAVNIINNNNILSPVHGFSTPRSSTTSTRRHRPIVTPSSWTNSYYTFQKLQRHDDDDVMDAGRQCNNDGGYDISTSLYRSRTTTRTRLRLRSKNNRSTRLWYSFLPPIPPPPLPPLTGGAMGALVIAAWIGQQMNRLLPSTGILATLITAAILSNGLPTIIPSSHYLYDLCWTTFLPASLTLMLLAFRTTEDNHPPPPSPNNKILSSTTNIIVKKRDQEEKEEKEEVSIPASIHAVAVPFIIAIFGSLLGCLISFGLWTSNVVSCTQWGMSLANAREATACVSASFVGGSVNFFATAKLIQGSNTLLGSLATADLIVMALYFTVLASILPSTYFQKLFHHPKQQHRRKEEEQQPQQQQPQKNVSSLPFTSFLKQSKQSKSNNLPSVVTNQNDDEDVTTNGQEVSFRDKSRAVALVLPLSLMIVQIANTIEGWVGRFIPGTACAVIAIVAPTINNYFRKRINSTTTLRNERRIKSTWWEMQTVASSLSDLMFYSLFASIGTSANVRQALESGPACLGFSFVALTVHIIITLVGCRLAQHCRLLSPLTQLEDILIASNAAIGGPATAAAFCGQMENGPRLRGWTMAATVWGVVGYAIGTTIGVGMFRLVGGTMPL